jgi:hypothetical protein
MIRVYPASEILTTSSTGRVTLKQKRLCLKNMKCVIGPLSKQVLSNMEQLAAGATGVFTYIAIFISNFIT